ncbi:MAG: ABC transporter ATP-binding protein [Symbiobacteriia bacterium]
MAHVTIDQLNKFYGPKHVVQDVSLEVEQGEFLTLLGPSGCGKSTTLRMVAGFEVVDGGRVLVNGADISAVPANRRGIGMVFQSYALFPNMTALDNVAFGLRMKKLDSRATRAKAEKMLAEVGLEQAAHQFPHQLSGGQQQRVALARALVREPEVLLLDEPLSALDAKIRVQLRDLIKEMQRRTGVTTIYVTHDQEEALSLSDRIAVMNKGVVVQVGNPNEIYTRPVDSFVATFVGTLNQFTGEVADSRQGVFAFAGQRFTMPTLAGRTGQATVGIRPEKVHLLLDGAAPDEGEVPLRGTLRSAVLLGTIVRITVSFGETEMKVDVLNNSRLPGLKPGDPVDLGISTENLLVLG